MRLTDVQMRALIQTIRTELKSTHGSPLVVHDRRFLASNERVTTAAGERHPGAPQAALQGDG